MSDYPLDPPTTEIVQPTNITVSTPRPLPETGADVGFPTFVAVVFVLAGMSALLVRWWITK